MFWGWNWCQCLCVCVRVCKQACVYWFCTHVYVVHTKFKLEIYCFIRLLLEAGYLYHKGKSCSSKLCSSRTEEYSHMCLKLRHYNRHFPCLPFTARLNTILKCDCLAAVCIQKHRLSHSVHSDCFFPLCEVI